MALGTDGHAFCRVSGDTIRGVSVVCNPLAITGSVVTVLVRPHEKRTLTMSFFTPFAQTSVVGKLWSEINERLPEDGTPSSSSNGRR